MNKKITLIFVLSVFFYGHCFGNEALVQNDKQIDANGYILQGENYKKENQLHKALVSYQKAVKEAPENADAHVGIAKIYARLKEYGQAAKEFKIAINLDQNLELSVLPNLVMIYLFEDNAPELKDCLQRLRQKDIYAYGMFQDQIVTARTYGIVEVEYGFAVNVQYPFTPTAEYQQLSSKAYPILEKEDFEKAVAIFQNVINSPTDAVENKAMAYFELGKIYGQYSNPMTGIESLRKAVEMFPDFLFWRQELASTLISTQLYTIALDETEQILKMSPDNKFALYAQGVIYNEFGSFEEAIASWDRLKSQDKVLFVLVEDSYDNAKKRLLAKKC